eukprot:7033768-Prymnesium_polylepis.1
MEALFSASNGVAAGRLSDTARITARAAQTQSARRAGTAARPRTGSGGGSIRQRFSAAIPDTGRRGGGLAPGCGGDGTAARTAARSA